MPDERKHGRKSVHTDGLDASFFVEINRQNYPFFTVNDVSVSGTGIRLPMTVDVGTPIRLHFQSDDYEVSVHGKVMWCDNPASQQGIREIGKDFRLGVEFDSTNGEDNAIFFLALRKYIDPFTHV